MTKALNELTIRDAALGLRAKTFSVRELWDACVSVAKKKNPELNAFLEIFDISLEELAVAQKRIDEEGERAPLLCGIPLAVKDNILIDGHIASGASKILSNYRATYDATVIKKLKADNALFLGRTNMDEFALGGSTENSAYGPTKNPSDLTRVAGGTSGGSACAVRAHMALGALGSDTGGSLRNPASYCGIVGFKPTYGAVSRSGLMAATSSFDQIGSLAHSVADARALFDVIKGKDGLDSTSIDFSAVATKAVKRIGVLRGFVKNLEPDMVSCFDATLERLKQDGIEIVDIDIPSAEPALAAYYIINFAEVSTNLARFDGIRYGDAQHGETLLDDYLQSRSLGFGAESKRRLILGAFVLSAGYIDAYYRKADATRELLRSDFTKAFETVDVVASPTMPTPAFVIGEHVDPLSLYLEYVFTVTANLTGMPAISVPMGTLNRKGVDLPVGIQFMGPHGDHERLFNIGALVTGE